MYCARLAERIGDRLQLYSHQFESGIAFVDELWKHKEVLLIALEELGYNPPSWIDQEDIDEAIKEVMKL